MFFSITQTAIHFQYIIVHTFSCNLFLIGGDVVAGPYMMEHNALGCQLLSVMSTRNFCKDKLHQL